MPKQGVELLTDDILEAVENRKRDHVLDHPAIVRAITNALEKLNLRALDIQDGKAA